MCSYVHVRFWVQDDAVGVVRHCCSWRTILARARHRYPQEQFCVHEQRCPRKKLLGSMPLRTYLRPFFHFILLSTCGMPRMSEDVKDRDEDIHEQVTKAR